MYKRQALDAPTGQGPAATAWAEGQEPAGSTGQKSTGGTGQKSATSGKRHTGDKQKSTGSRQASAAGGQASAGGRGESSSSGQDPSDDVWKSSGGAWGSSDNGWESSGSGGESSAGGRGFPGRSLRRGSQGDPVVRLQIRLGIFADGWFGPRTAHGVRAFQASAGLAIDTVVGPRTWDALFGAPASPVAAPTPATAPTVTSTVVSAVASTATLVVTPAAAAVPVGASTSAATAALAAAERQIGKPYRYGAAGPDDFDCSGLVQYAYAQAGVSIPRTTYDQFAALRPVGSAEARPGDVVFFLDAEGEAYHDAIYAGNGQMIVSRRPGTNVQYQDIWSGDYRIGRV
ncbi:NlpC/P60 family protein [Frankia sp. CiP1_Cm_nod2]|uniref:NlpC/P60 family protein n=1 Tax=Frankia sp. CiP1_Cm_nod2 TaxID=2897161 RepID=UPI002024CB28